MGYISCFTTTCNVSPKLVLLIFQLLATDWNIGMGEPPPSPPVTTRRYLYIGTMVGMDSKIRWLPNGGQIFVMEIDRYCYIHAPTTRCRCVQFAAIIILIIIGSGDERMYFVFTNDLHMLYGWSSMRIPFDNKHITMNLIFINWHGLMGCQRISVA